MRPILLKSTAILALASFAPVQAATAPCISRAEMKGMVTYALPIVISTAADTCAGVLSANDVFSSRSKELLAELEPLRPAAFPAAKTAILKIGGNRDSKTTRILEGLPDESFRPFVDAVVSEELGSTINPSACGDISRIFATVAPLPAANLVDFTTEVLIIASRKDKRMRSCPES